MFCLRTFPKTPITSRKGKCGHGNLQSEIGINMVGESESRCDLVKVSSCLEGTYLPSSCGTLSKSLTSSNLGFLISKIGIKWLKRCGNVAPGIVQEL